MHKKITFRGMEHSNTIEDFVKQHLRKVEHLLEQEPEPIYLEVVLDSERTHHHHMAECLLKTPHYDLFTKSEGPDMYLVIADVIDTMEVDLARRKRELVDKRKVGLKKRE